MEVVLSGDDCLTADCSPVPAGVTMPTYGAVRSLSDMHMDYNIYYSRPTLYSSASVEFVDRVPAHFWRSKMATGTLSGWRNHTGFDFHSHNADPRLDSAFTPNAQSPGYQSAAALDWVTDDFYGRTRAIVNGKVDIGAVANQTASASARVAGGRYPPNPSAADADPCRYCCSVCHLCSPGARR